MCHITERLLMLVAWLGLLQSVEGMKMLCYELMDATSGKVSQSTLAAFAAAANNLVVILTSKIIEVRQAASYLLHKACSMQLFFAAPFLAILLLSEISSLMTYVCQLILVLWNF